MSQRLKTGIAGFVIADAMKVRLFAQRIKVGHRHVPVALTVLELVAFLSFYHLEINLATKALRVWISQMSTESKLFLAVTVVRFVSTLAYAQTLDSRMARVAMAASLCSLLLYARMSHSILEGNAYQKFLSLFDWAFSVDTANRYIDAAQSKWLRFFH